MQVNTSWKTTLLGWIIIVGDLIGFVTKSIEDQGMPTTVAGWIPFIVGLAVGIMGIFSKDRDVTGLPKATP
jgi:hypothetical protein